MRVVVLNGVNLDVLGRRDPETYGGLTLSELETTIYEWAAGLGCTVRCRQTNHEGEFVDWCHDALDWADGVVANPSAWTQFNANLGRRFYKGGPQGDLYSESGGGYD